MRHLWYWLAWSLPLLAKVDSFTWDNSQASEEESLFLRRIADFWQEGEYGIAKNQIEEFLSKFSESRFADPLRMSLGDMQLQATHYAEALDCYSAVTSPELLEKTFLNRMQCLYHLEWYATLADECENYLSNLPKTEEAQETNDALKATYFLAISLYRQCLNAVNEPDVLLRLAKRAEPHFETLFESALSIEVSQAFAHLSCILKDYERAVDIYLSLAEKDPSISDEMLFQAALIQAEYDKETALKSFENLASGAGSQREEAAYNRLVLLFEIGSYEQIIEEKEAILMGIPTSRQALARLFFGRSQLHLSRYADAISDLRAYLDEQPHSEPTLAGLLEAAYQSGDLKVLNSTLAHIQKHCPTSSLIPKAKLSKALLLKQSQSWGKAKQELLEVLDQTCPEQILAAFELIDLEYQTSAWEPCVIGAREFLEKHPSHAFAASVWRRLATASSKLALENKAIPSFTERFIQDLKALFAHKELFTPSEIANWQFFQAKAFHDLGGLQEAMTVLKEILEYPDSFSQKANAQLLMAICHKDFLNDEAAFCLHAEAAIQQGADLLEPNSLEISLFNAYLNLSKLAPELLDNAAEHLFNAFAMEAEIAKENLIWLGEWYLSRFEEKKDPFLAERAERVLSFFSNPNYETPFYKLGTLYAQLRRTQEQVVLCEQLIAAYEETPLKDWRWKEETRLLLAEGYASLNKENEATTLLDQIIADGSALRSKIVARAYLQKALLQIKALKRGDLEDSVRAEIASELKSLTLQRRLANEPLHLEAALEYADLLGDAPQKRLRILEKIKTDFQKSDDLIGQDYAQARLQLDAQNRIYEQYMQFIDAQLFLIKATLASDPAEQKELQAKAKNLLLQIKGDHIHDLLISRIESLLQNALLTDASISE